MKMEGAPKSAFYLAVYYQCLGGKFSRGDGYAGDPDGGDRQIPKRSCSAGRGCFEIQRPEDCPAVFQMLLLMAEGYAAGYRGAAAFDFQAVMEDFEKNIAILRENFYKEEY